MGERPPKGPVHSGGLGRSVQVGTVQGKVSVRYAQQRQERNDRAADILIPRLQALVRQHLVSLCAEMNGAR